MSVTTDIIVTQQNHIGIMTLNRLQALNALTFPMIMTLQEQLLKWKDDSSVQAVVIRSAGSKAFCAGGDVRFLYETRNDESKHQLVFFQEEYRLNQLIHDYPKPYIALMDGLTMGGGVGISLHGSHPVASPAFVFAMPETGIGFFPDIGSSFLLSRCPGRMGVYLGLTGNRLNAQEACALGLVKYIIPGTAFDQIIDKLIQMDLSYDADAKVSSCLTTASEPVRQDVIASLLANVNGCFDYPDVMSIFHALAQHEDDWHREVLSTLKQKSPLSLCITLNQLLKAAHLSFDNCIRMDYQLVQHFMTDHDFYEGVRALLIDKDKSPQWRPASLSEIDDHLINRYFV